MSVLEAGREGERWAREWLLEETAIEGLFQADWIAEAADGSYFIVEVKHQAIFVPPPFFGHGLPPYQVEARLKFQQATGIPTLLLIRDAESGSAFWQWLEVLNAGEQYLTNGPSPRVIYPLTAFEGGEA